MTRKRGAQPGNKNAYQHGFYSQHFKTEEQRILSQMSLTDLSGEIELMRIQLNRFMEAQNNLPQPLDFESQTTSTRIVYHSTESINSLVRTQIVLAQVTKESDEIIERLLEISLEDELDNLENPSSEQ